MGQFDKDLIEKPVLTEGAFCSLKYNTFLGDLLHHHGALICLTNDDKGLRALIDMITMYVIEINQSVFLPGRHLDSKGILSPNDSVLTIPPVLQKHNRRSIITLDCSGLKKGDALGFLHRLSQLPAEQKPVVVINNITSIPPAGSITDDPLYVENLLLHSWHNDVIRLADKDGAPFTITPRDFTILIPVSKQKKTNINMSRLRNDCYPHLQF